MLANLMTPSGRLGNVTVVIAALLATAGVVGIILGASGIGIEDDGERIGATIVGVIAMCGSAGLAVQVRHPLLGGILAVLGSMAAALLNSWLILPVLIVPVTLVVVIMRARRLTGHNNAGFAQRGV